MSDRCPEMEELIAAATRPDAATSHHVRECPRCRNRLRLWDEFRAAPVEGGAPAPAARLRLQELIDHLATAPAGAAAREESRPAPAMGIVERFRQHWGAGSLRPALVAASLVIVAGAAFMTWQMTHPGPDMLRGAGSSEVFVELEAPRSVPAGVELSWAPVEGADSYQVRLLTAELTEIRTLAVPHGTGLVVSADSLPTASAAGEVLAYRVVALRGGAVVASSRVGTLRRP